MDVRLSVIIPCYNESRTLRLLVGRVAAQDRWVRQIIVVDDGSSDETASVTEALGREWTSRTVRFDTVRLPVNRGKGAAVRAGIEKASEPYVLIQDADLELDPREYGALVEPIESGRADVVFGNRFPQGFPSTLGRLSKVANVIVTEMTNLLYGLGLDDQACGYKLATTSLLRELSLTSDGFEICSEMAAKIGLRRLRVANIPVSYHPRDEEGGKKIHWKDGFLAVYTLLRHRFR